MRIVLDENGLSFGAQTTAIIGSIQFPITDISLVVQSIITSYDKNHEGYLVKALAVPWMLIVSMLNADPRQMFQISPQKWEELMAATFSISGFDEVVLTPRSGDYGRDVIATKNGVGSIRILNSVKAYSPGNLVRHDDVRALLGVLSSDLNATKAIITTTSDFAPNIKSDQYIKQFIPYRLELMNGEETRKWFNEIMANLRK